MESLTEITQLLQNVKCLSSRGGLAEAKKLLENVVCPKIVEYSSKNENFGSDHLKFVENVLRQICSVKIKTESLPLVNVVNLENIKKENPENDENVKKETENGNESATNRKNLDHFCDDRSSIVKNTIVKVDVSQNFQKTVVGLQIAKQALTEAIVDPVKFPHWFTNGRQPWRSILLYGPPGTGKSRLANALAGELQSAVVYHVSSTDIVSTWMGQSEKLIRDLFNDALNRNQTALIFIDEIDSLCRARSAKEEESSRRLKTEFLMQMERARNESSKVFLLGATNCPWEIDTAFLRRFQKRIFIGLPDKQSRIEMLKHILTVVKIDAKDWSLIGDKTEGMSGSDLSVLAQEVLYRPLREIRSAKAWRQNFDGTYSPTSSSEHYLTYKRSVDDIPKELIRPRDVEIIDVLASLTDVQRTVSDDDLIRFKNFTDKFGLVG